MPLRWGRFVRSSFQEYLIALGFVTSGETFVCGDILIPFVALHGHSVSSFADKMRFYNWMPPTLN